MSGTVQGSRELEVGLFVDRERHGRRFAIIVQVNAYLGEAEQGKVG